MSSQIVNPAAVPGRFGPYGGRYVPETLMVPLFELERAYEKARRDPKFQKRLDLLLKTYAGRPTPLFFAARRAVALRPNYPPNVLALAEAMAKTGDSQGALDAYRGARDLIQPLPPSQDRDDWLRQADQALSKLSAAQ